MNDEQVKGEDQENIAPVSRIPRPAGPSPALKSGIPTLSGLAAKRKAPSSPIPQPAKRVASGSQPSALGQSTRKASSGFLPTARKAVVPTATRSGSVPLGRGSTSTSGRSGSLASTSSAGSTSTISTRNRPVGIGATKRPPTSASASASSSAVRPGAVGARAASVGRGVSPGLSAIGSGVASIAQVKVSPQQDPADWKNHSSRLETMERRMELIAQEQAKGTSTPRNALIPAAHDQQIREAQQALHAQNQSIERENRRNLANASEEIAALKASHQREVEELEKQVQRKDREKRGLEEELRDSRDEISHERQTVRDLKQSMAEQSTQHMTLSAQLVASQTQLSILQAEVQRATLSVSSMKAELEVGRQKARDAEDRALDKIREAEEDRDRRIGEIEEELRAAETIRRKLHNQVQELKGNIRVFARVRPALPHESESPDGVADIKYGDERKEAELGQSEIAFRSRSETAMGKEREQVHSFLFDKVFKPASGQKEVFEEISMLAQSVLDGYNVCIFAYGQTGSGKSWTMEGGDSDETAGMIPRAIDMIFSASAHLKDRGWKYQMEGQFLEVYNEVINDLLGSGQFDSKKHEIKHDKDGNMTVTDAVSIPLSNPRQVHTLLDRAKSRRAVAATLMNERSSRSHSVFTLKVRGVNPLTDERCEAMLNLVDLAGSERLTNSGAGADKDRLKETININKSLSALADVIGALGQGQAGGHVPYRNSTLTRLLQSGLSGSSKTLMMCNLSPLSAHLGETLCSLRFATKVNSTVVGSAKKQVKN